ncbi:MAG: MgtC/SapB family protein [Eubacterium sp.]|nr:MgtC/SapB family protein [Eubacterium sp.]
MTNVLQEFSFLTVVVRLLLGAAAGAAIGYGRTKKQRTAGIRTFTLTATGATLTVLIAIYEYEMTQTRWADIVAQYDLKFDASRFSAQVISGIGFLAAGTILATAHQQTSGLTTATGLFASVCMGIAAGAGFYVCVITVTVLIIVVLDVMTPMEHLYKRRHRNITLFIEFESLDSIAEISRVIRERHATVYDIEIERERRQRDKLPSAIFSLKLGKGHSSHSDMLSSLAELDCVNAIQELIA